MLMTQGAQYTHLLLKWIFNITVTNMQLLLAKDVDQNV